MNNKKRLNGIGILGCIINVMSSIIMMIILLIGGFLIIYRALEFGNYLNIFLFDEVLFDTLIIMSIVILLFIFSYLSLVKNSGVLRGKLNKKTSATVFSFLSFSLIGSILLMFAKVITVVETVKIKIIEEIVDYNGLVKLIVKYKELLDSDIITNEEYKLLKDNLFKQLK